jgi:outer membrane protein assembly factor BamB
MLHGIVPRRSRLFVALLALSNLVTHAQWPEYRGPWSNGHVSAPGDTKAAGLPLHWSESRNVRWKTPIPLRGWSTPVVLNGQIWLTTASEDGHDFFALCVEADTGKIVFDRELFHADSPEPLGNPVNGYASPSPVIEPGRVYVHFGSYGTACLDTAHFNLLWKRNDLPCRHYRGPGSSPLLVGRLLILSMDGVDLQYVVALDKTTGRTVWKTDRSADWNDLGPDGRPIGGGDFRKAFSTPLIVEANGKTQLISVGAKAAYGYDPANGRELWKVRHLGQAPAPRPLFGHGLVFVTTGFGRTELLAIRPDGEGDVTDTHVAWRTNRGVPKFPSPVLVDDLLFLLSDNGIVTCLEAETGKPVWQERIGGEYYASPLYANGRLYCFDTDGKARVIQAGRRFEAVATNSLDAGFMASPAASGKALFLRTKTHLYRIESD